MLNCLKLKEILNYHRGYKKNRYFLLQVFSTFYLFIQTGEQFVLSFSLSLFGLFLAIIAIILLFVAIWTVTPYLLVPHLLMQVKFLKLALWTNNGLIRLNICHICIYHKQFKQFL